jgi:GWxTD domain-containing protein
MRALLGPVEFAEYITLTDTLEASEWLRRFWVRHDPTPTTPINEFHDEHEQRVYHAIYLFGLAGTGGPPWDERGEVYIRYGRPDERLIRHAGIDDDDRRGRKRPSSGFFRDDFGTALNDRGLTTEVWTFYRWNETFQFEDRHGFGQFEMVPVTDPYSERQDVAEFYATRLSAVDLQPAIHFHEYGRNLIDYALDVVRFQGDSSQWRIDVNLGYPLSELSRGPDSNWISIRRTIIIRNENEEEVYAEGGRIHRLVGRSSSHRLMVEQKLIELPPGRYTLAVTIEDMYSEKTGTYVKTFRLPEYFIPEVQEISDIEMASHVWSIYEPGSPFIKNGHQVVPLPSRVYLPAQPVAFYYEVYNLLLGEDSLTHYKVSYEVSDADGNLYEDIHPRTLSGLTHEKRSHGRVGTIVIDKIPAGEYFLTITVTDEIGRHDRSAVIRFRKSS